MVYLGLNAANAQDLEADAFEAVYLSLAVSVRQTENFHYV